MPSATDHSPRRSLLLPALHEAQAKQGWLTPALVREAAALARLPEAWAWEVATSYPDFRFEPPPTAEPVCTGLSCSLAGAAPGPGQCGVACRFRCYDAPAPGAEAPFPEDALRVRGPLLAPESGDAAGLESARRMGRAAALELLERSGLRGRGGAYFPVGRKWAAALAEGRDVALVVNAEEGEPGIFKDRALLCRRPRRFLEGLAIAMTVLSPAVTVIFLNGEAGPAFESLQGALANGGGILPGEPRVVRGAGGYVLGEETTLLNAIEGRKPVPRTRPPFPVEAGLWGMPTVVNNVETIANLAILFREGPEDFRRRGTAEAPGTKLLSVSGLVRQPGLYEVPLGTTIRAVLAMAGGPAQGEATAVLAGGPSGGFLPPQLFDVALLPGLLHPTGAVTGSGGLVFLDETADIRRATLAMASFNAAESCGKCTPCREGTPRVVEMLEERRLDGMEDLLEVIGLASLCGLGQMAPGPVRSALHFWPELFR
jgi:NADH:ubiquinone oxidoreductase subunit F (NADH-binding)